jgi:NADPH2:quinone reductase
VKAVQVAELRGAEGVVVNEVPEPSAGENVLVEVHAAGISFPDVLKSQGLYQEKPDLPFTIGGEFSGVVVSAPAGSDFAAGDRVAGISMTGSALERVAVTRESLIPVPESITFEQAAALPLNYSTAVLALEIRARMEAGEVVLVHGAAGGTGTAAIQVANALGGRAIGVVSSASKEETARAAGASDVVRSDEPWKDRVLALTGGRGVDIVFDPVGGDRVLDTMRSLAPAGRWVVIGFVGGAIPEVALNRVLLRNISIVGAYYGGWLGVHPEARAEIGRRIVDLIGSGHIKPIVGSVHGLDDPRATIREMIERRAVGKVVLKMR